MPVECEIFHFVGGSSEMRDAQRQIARSLSTPELSRSSNYTRFPRRLISLTQTQSSQPEDEEQCSKTMITITLVYSYGED